MPAKPLLPLLALTMTMVACGRQAMEVPPTDGFAAVREDRGDAGVDGIAVIDGDLAHEHAGDIGDGVQRAWRQHAGRDTNLPRARACLCDEELWRHARDHPQKEKQPS